MNGKALCLMTMEMFCQRVPLGGKMLYKDFQLRLSMALYGNNNKCWKKQEKKTRKSSFWPKKMPKFIQDRPLKLKCYLRTLKNLIFLRVSKHSDTTCLLLPPVIEYTSYLQDSTKIPQHYVRIPEDSARNSHDSLRFAKFLQRFHNILQVFRKVMQGFQEILPRKWIQRFFKIP